MQNKFSDRLRELRGEKGLSQGALAASLNYTQSNISEWEQGKVEPKLSAMKVIADFFNVSIDYLAGRTDELGGVVMPGAVQLSGEERELLNCYRQLRFDLQELLLSTAKTWAAAPVESAAKKKA